MAFRLGLEGGGKGGLGRREDTGKGREGKGKGSGIGGKEVGWGRRRGEARFQKLGARNWIEGGWMNG